LSAGMGLALNFADSLAASSGQTFTEKDSINELRSNFGDKSDSVTGNANEPGNTKVEENQFFLTSVFNIMSDVVNSARSVIGIGSIIQSATGLPMPGAVQQLLSLITVGVIFAFVAAARGWDV